MDAISNGLYTQYASVYDNQDSKTIQSLKEKQGDASNEEMLVTEGDI